MRPVFVVVARIRARKRPVKHTLPRFEGRAQTSQCESHVDVKDAATFKGEYDEDVEHLEPYRWHRDEIDREGAVEMVAHEPQVCDGGRRGRSAGFGMYLATVFLSTR